VSPTTVSGSTDGLRSADVGLEAMMRYEPGDDLPSAFEADSRSVEKHTVGEK